MTKYVKLEQALSYDDVLLRPLFSEIESRSQVSLNSKLGSAVEFRTPIIASPMDTVSGLEMALKLSQLGGVAVIHRYNSIQEQADIVREVKNKGERVGAAVGSSGDYMDRVSALYKAGVDFICIDVAHGHHKMVYDTIHNIRDQYGPSLHIMAGNVATSEAFEALQAWGANSIRVGIGGGCFLPDTQVITISGVKNIQDITVKDQVLTHDGTFKPVMDTLCFDRDEEIININNIKCTKNHEFYVIPKEVSHLVNEDNIHKYAKWVEAWELDKEKHLLIEIENNY
jgi:IMP dehydrogenase